MTKCFVAFEKVVSKTERPILVQSVLIGKSQVAYLSLSPSRGALCCSEGALESGTEVLFPFLDSSLNVNMGILIVLKNN